MNIRDNFKCKHCNESSKDLERMNCCGEIVCKKHIDELLLQTTNDSLHFML